jgi:hypothetical protein
VFINAETIKHATPRMVAVPIPEWCGEGAEVNVRAMSGTQRFAFEASIEKDKDADLRARLAAFTICDAEGNLLFEDPESGVAILAARDFVALDRVFATAVELNKLTRKSVDELEKN